MSSDIEKLITHIVKNEEKEFKVLLATLVKAPNDFDSLAAALNKTNVEDEDFRENIKVNWSAIKNRLACERNLNKESEQKTIEMSGNPPVNVTVTGKNALAVAASLGRLEMVKALLEAGADVNYLNEGQTRTTLTYAVENGHLAVVDLLCRKGANPAAGTKIINVDSSHIGMTLSEFRKTAFGFVFKDKTPVENALEIVKVLCRVNQQETKTENYAIGFKGNSDVRTMAQNKLLDIAVIANHVPVAKLLIDNHTQISCIYFGDRNGKPYDIFIAALIVDCPEIVKLLLQKNPTFKNSKDVNGYDVMTVAIKAGHSNVIKELCAGGVLTNREAKSEFSIGSYCAGALLCHPYDHAKSLAIVNELLAGSQLTDAIRKDLQTALDLAIDYSNVDVFQKLLNVPGGLYPYVEGSDNDSEHSNNEAKDSDEESEYVDLKAMKGTFIKVLYHKTLPDTVKAQMLAVFLAKYNDGESLLQFAAHELHAADRLFYAVSEKQYQTAAALAEYQILGSTFAYKDDGNTVVHLLVADNQLALVKKIAGNYIHCLTHLNIAGYTPMHLAIKSKNPQMVKVLAAAMPECCNTESVKCESPLIFLLQGNNFNLDIFRELIRARVRLNETCFRAILAREDAEALINIIFGKEEIQTSLGLESKQNQARITLAKDVECFAKAIEEAHKNGKTKLAAFILDKALIANINIGEQAPRRLSIDEKGFGELFKYFVTAPKPDFGMLEIFFNSNNRFFSSKDKFFFRHGDKNYTPLTYVINFFEEPHRSKFIRQLVEKCGADIDQKEHVETALITALELRGDKVFVPNDAIKTVVSETKQVVPAVVSQTNSSDQKDSPPVKAAQENKSTVVDLLLELKANANLANDKGISPLRKSVEVLNPKHFSSLLRAGADIQKEQNKYPSLLQVFFEKLPNNLAAFTDHSKESLLSMFETLLQNVDFNKPPIAPDFIKTTTLAGYCACIVANHAPLGHDLLITLVKKIPVTLSVNNALNEVLSFYAASKVLLPENLTGILEFISDIAQLKQVKSSLSSNSPFHLSFDLRIITLQTLEKTKKAMQEATEKTNKARLKNEKTRIDNAINNKADRLKESKEKTPSKDKPKQLKVSSPTKDVELKDASKKTDIFSRYLHAQGISEKLTIIAKATAEELATLPTFTLAEVFCEIMRNEPKDLHQETRVDKFWEKIKSIHAYDVLFFEMSDKKTPAYHLARKDQKQIFGPIITEILFIAPRTFLEKAQLKDDKEKIPSWAMDLLKPIESTNFSSLLDILFHIEDKIKNGYGVLLDIQRRTRHANRIVSLVEVLLYLNKVDDNTRQLGESIWTVTLLEVIPILEDLADDYNNVGDFTNLLKGLRMELPLQLSEVYKTLFVAAQSKKDPTPSAESKDKSSVQESSQPPQAKVPLKGVIARLERQCSFFNAFLAARQPKCKEELETEMRLLSTQRNVIGQQYPAVTSAFSPPTIPPQTPAKTTPPQNGAPGASSVASHSGAASHTPQLRP